MNTQEIIERKKALREQYHDLEATLRAELMEGCTVPNYRVSKLDNNFKVITFKAFNTDNDLIFATDIDVYYETPIFSSTKAKEMKFSCGSTGSFTSSETYVVNRYRMLMWLVDHEADLKVILDKAQNDLAEIQNEYNSYPETKED